MNSLYANTLIEYEDKIVELERKIAILETGLKDIQIHAKYLSHAEAKTISEIARNALKEDI